MATVQRSGRCSTELDELMTDIQAMANDLTGSARGHTGKPVKISWSDNKAIRAAHASYSILFRRIWVSTAFRDAPEEVVRCLVAHELGHAEDKLLHTLTALCLGVWLVCGGLILFASDTFLNNLAFIFMVAGICGGLVLLSEKPISWEVRADQWAEKVVGKELYWSNKAAISEWAGRAYRHTSADRMSR